MDKLYTWCYFTEFVCRYEQLDEAKERHQRCVDVLREDYTVHFSSEQAFQKGQSEPLFGLLLSEIVLPEQELSDEEKDEYSTFCFVTVVDVPHTPRDDDEFRKVGGRLEIDWEPGIPAKFPSRTRGIIVSATVHEIEGCIYQ
ncbi:hypothetical protein CCYS_02385 [Corynebacterium cystitidis DSM 20524]|uniref:Uncharacterized protein n=2 Tax=Corynebacterium cystitidis TaxID=35757 RepID=A0A1H9RG02_9CORY|nr:hypothetical protein CCYS_02385 [Corynebacterium cystitidis DSM 20524]SER71485.1 hypothetical protein SAMN05661109_00880 [Corynebacterium cystitidis DSM 20524]SNV87328.1 Uncharacterised protein [Corynebacterium cystitidis]